MADAVKTRLTGRNLAELAKLLDGALRSAAGSGHSVEFGSGSKRRYDPETGEPYYTEPHAYLSTSPAKMRAIWDVWEAVPELLAALRSALSEHRQ